LRPDQRHHARECRQTASAGSHPLDGDDAWLASPVLPESRAGKQHFLKAHCLLGYFPLLSQVVSKALTATNNVAPTRARVSPIRPRQAIRKANGPRQVRTRGARIQIWCFHEVVKAGDSGELAEPGIGYPSLAGLGASSARRPRPSPTPHPGWGRHIS
jgi:hypothetical protein